MKKSTLSRLTALTLSAVLTGTCCHLPVSAASDKISIDIDQYVLTPEELEEMGYVVPIYVTVTENAGFDSAEFGVRVSGGCTYETDIKWLDFDDGYAVTNGDLTWRALANYENWYDTGTILKLDVRLPLDAEPGDVFEIEYVTNAYKSHIWSSIMDGKDYLQNNAVNWNDGFIRIVDEEHPDPAEALFTMGRDNWSFLNSWEYFGTSGYSLEDEYYNKLIDGLSYKEKEKLDAVIDGNWHGSCFGLAVTSILAYHDILKPEEWRADAEYLYDIKAPLDDDLKSLINYYYMLQKTNLVQQVVADAVHFKTEEEKLKHLLSCLEDDSPTLLTYLDYDWGGHAVVAYDVVYGLYSFGGRSYNGKVIVYDNNMSTINDEACLYFNTSDWSWCLPTYQLSSHSGSYLGIISDDVNAINYHGYLDGTKILSEGEYISILTSASVLTDYTLVPVQENAPTADKPKLSTAAQKEIKAYSPISNGADDHEVCFALPDAESAYALYLQAPEAVSLSMDYENSLLRLDASAAQKVQFSPNGGVSMKGEAADYSAQLVFNEAQPTSWYSLTVEGQDADNASVERTEQGYLLTASNLHRISVSTKAVENCDVFGFSTEYDSVLIYETNGVPAAAVDTDGDGTYETAIASADQLSAGDVTLDGTLSMTDLIALNHNLLCGEHLNTAQVLTADYDGDGVPTASDALELLKQILAS